VPWLDPDNNDGYKENMASVRLLSVQLAVSLIGAVLIWLVGRLIFIPLAENIMHHYLGYTLVELVSGLFIISLAVRFYTVFRDIHRLTNYFSKALAYHFEPESLKVWKEEYDNFKVSLNSIINVFMFVLIFLLFADYIAIFHTALPAVVLIIVLIFSLLESWRSMKAVRGIAEWYFARIWNSGKTI